MRKQSVTLEQVQKVLGKQPKSAKEVAERLGVTGSSSVMAVRHCLERLAQQRKAVGQVRRGRRGRPALVYSLK